LQTGKNQSTSRSKTEPRQETGLWQEHKIRRKKKIKIREKGGKEVPFVGGLADTGKSLYRRRKKWTDKSFMEDPPDIKKNHIERVGSTPTFFRCGEGKKRKNTKDSTGQKKRAYLEVRTKKSKHILRA